MRWRHTCLNLAQTWLSLARTCDVLAQTWPILARTCDVLTQTGPILARTCDVLTPTWPILARICDVLAQNSIVHTGWAHPGWLRFDRWIKKRGAKVVVTVDNHFKGNLRQWIGALWFRLWLSRHFDAALVPGRSATRLLRLLGMPRRLIQTGYYGAYEGIYSAGLPMLERREEFLFVGQLIRRKGVDLLLEAFRYYREGGGTWNLRILGSGPLEEYCTGDGVIFEGFGQARHVAQRMKEARCLVLPSREDYPGTVVCDAMACGMPVIASRWVGAGEDLIRTGINGWVFKEMTPAALAQAMGAVSSWGPDVQGNAQRTAIGLASGYGAGSYFATFNSLARLTMASH